MTGNYSLATELFELVDGLYRADIESPVHIKSVIDEREGRQINFQGNPEIFGGYIALSPLTTYRDTHTGDESVVSATISLDNGDSLLTVDAQTYIDPKDPYAQWFAEQFRALVIHPHEICKAAIAKETAESSTGSQLARLRSATTGQEIFR